MISQSELPVYDPSNPDHRLYLFLENNKLLLRRAKRADRDGYVLERLNGNSLFQKIESGVPVAICRNGNHYVFFSNVKGCDIPPVLAAEGCETASLRTIEAYGKEGGRLSAELLEDGPVIRAHAIRIPYLNFKETDYIYRFRTDKQRNRDVYHVDASSMALYHSALCDAIKAVKRTKERSAADPARLDFGAVEYLLPSHFGFCLGVQNAIERAYETIASNPDKRVFMLSELIHNPFVNEDLRRRGLRYLQSDKGVSVVDPETDVAYWDSVTDEDIVIIPAFGARDEDKLRLIERGLPLNAYDATCMLVEKVWKAAKRFGQKGFTVVIHGKAEHEETKATFSNSSKYSPSIVVRDLKEAALLAEVIKADNETEKAELFLPFKARCSEGFDLSGDLAKLAVVNQTTLLRNETLRIIELLESALEDRYGRAHIEEHMAMSSKGDTLCYATQVNQDALAQAIKQPVDVAIVVGGKNSSNTYQLYRICEEAFGERAFYIQSESNILSRSQIEHFIFPYDPKNPQQGRMETRAFLPMRDAPMKILITGGASCPDGLLQQIIAKVNSYFDSEQIRSLDEVITGVGAMT